MIHHQIFQANDIDAALMSERLSISLQKTKDKSNPQGPDSQSCSDPQAQNIPRQLEAALSTVNNLLHKHLSQTTLSICRLH